MASALSSARPELAMACSVGAPAEERTPAGRPYNSARMRLLAAIGDLDRFFELAVFSGAGNLGRETRADCLRAG